jgi:hypothetical protein
LLFDMDSVLLKSEGYHRALQETVRKSAVAAGFGNVHLSRDQINQFEAMGVSSEWHSSAACLAALMIEWEAKRHRTSPVADRESEISDRPSTQIELDVFFNILSSHSLKIPAKERLLASIQVLAEGAGVDPTGATQLIRDSETISKSVTMRCFQELILGSVVYEETYRLPAELDIESYLSQYDVPLLSRVVAEKIRSWVREPAHGAAIMTNRPSNTLVGALGTPEAEMGAELVGLSGIPIVGYGELMWLAVQNNVDASEYSKPAWQHGLAAILCGAGWPIQESLLYAGRPISEMREADLLHLNGSVVTVFEDTPGGLIAVQQACRLLRRMGIQLQPGLIGVAEDATKRKALVGQGARIFPTIDQALSSVDDL